MQAKFLPRPEKGRLGRKGICACMLAPSSVLIPRGWSPLFLQSGKGEKISQVTELSGTNL